MDLDDKDWSILDTLRENAKLSRQQVAKRTGLPVMTVHNRIRRLEQEGVIKQYSVVLDHKKLGKALTAYLLVHVDTGVLGKTISREEYIKRLRAIPSIEEIKSITGHFDILLKFRLRDMEEMRDILIGQLRKLPGVGNTETIFVLDDIK